MEPEIHFLNVGQGDCVLVKFPTGEILLVDSNYRDEESPPAIPLLNRIAAERNNNYDIDVLCLTHPDKDHYRGMTEVINHVESNGGRVKNLILFESSFKDLGPIVRDVLERLKGRETPDDALVPPALEIEAATQLALRYVTMSLSNRPWFIFLSTVV